MTEQPAPKLPNYQAPKFKAPLVLKPKPVVPKTPLRSPKDRNTETAANKVKYY